MKKILIGIFLISIGIQAFSVNIPDAETENARFIVSGYIRDASNGEELIGATVFIEELKSGTVSNVYGYYSLNLTAGKYKLIFSYIGFQNVSREVQLSQNQVINIELQPAAQTLSEVKITGEALNTNITRTEMSVSKMDAKVIEKIPALMGEVDVIKAMQLLPGVTSVAEGSSGFSVRGGGIDQNLIILDEANVYNAGHLMGFFSVFNNDAIKDLKLYKGDIPAEYGGRMSSVVDIRMKEGNMKKFSGRGGIGTISGRAMLEGPIWEDHTSFLVAGRRTWADLFLPLASDPSLHDNKLFFYDLNAKLNHKINDNNRLFFSGYFGRDIFKNQYSNIMFGNATVSTRWNHLFSQKLFSNVTLTYSNYYYSLGSDYSASQSFIWKAELNDVAMKFDLGYYATPEITLNYGINAIAHDFKPGYARGIGEESLFDEFRVPEKQALEIASYISTEHKVTPRLTLKYGLRVSGFVNYNCDSVYSYNENFEETGKTDYKNKFYGSYMHPEPRAGFVFLLNEFSSIKGSYSRNAQYLQLAQNSNAGTPLDIWFSASNNVKPQVCDQFGLGYFHNLFDNKIETSVEVFYKDMKNTIDFRDFSNLLLNHKMEGELRFGTSYSYGAEFLVKYNFEKLSGWISYTYSRAKRTIEQVNKGNEFVAPYDKPHDVAIVGNYELNKRVGFAANWVYSTGNPVTYPAGKAIIGDQTIPIYTGRNEHRMPAYHRLDVSVTLKNKQKPGRKWEGEWNFSVYNVYNRKNAWAINFVDNEDIPGATKAVMTYLFPAVPSISYNLKF